MARKASICSSPLYYLFLVLQIVVLVELVRGYSSAVSGLRARTQFPSFSATSPLLHHRRHFLTRSTYDSSASTQSKFRPTSLNAFPRFPATPSPLSLTRRASVINSGTDSESEGPLEEGNINNQVQQSFSDDAIRDEGLDHVYFRDDLDSDSSLFADLLSDDREHLNDLEGFSTNEDLEGEGPIASEGVTHSEGELITAVTKEEPEFIKWDETTPELEALLAQSLQIKRVRFPMGKIVTGIIVGKLEDRGLYVESHEQGKICFMPMKEIAALAGVSAKKLTTAEKKRLREKGDIAAIDPLSMFEIEDEIRGEIIGYAGSRHKRYPILSQRKQAIRDMWEELTALRENHTPVTVRVIDCNKAGLGVAYKNVRGFLPANQISGPHNTTLIGKNKTVIITAVLKDEGNVFFSEKRYLSSIAPCLTYGQVVTGKVMNVKDFGVFVDLDGLMGLIHISQVSGEGFASIYEHFRTRERVKAMVLSHDKVTGRIALSTAALEPAPGDILRDKAAVMAAAEETVKSFLLTQPSLPALPPRNNTSTPHRRDSTNSPPPSQMNARTPRPAPPPQQWRRRPPPPAQATPASTAAAAVANAMQRGDLLDSTSLNEGDSHSVKDITSRIMASLDEDLLSF